MFGRQEAIISHLPHYKVDYRELPDEITLQETGQRYLDRVHLDGTWSGNLVDFYRRVFPKLVADLKVPFLASENYTRKAQSPFHEALQEALVNSLIHADHYGTSGIVVLRRREGFEFRNPGDLRVPKERALRGGVSDCRNPALQAMIQMLGVGDRMGSGVPMIMNAWKAQHWRAPSLEEDRTLNVVSLRLDMASLLPNEVLERLDQKFPESFRRLRDKQRMALVTAEVEGAVTNGRMQELCGDHPRDLTALLQDLVSQGFLEQNGAKRGTWYTPAKPSGRPSSVETQEGCEETKSSSVESSVESARVSEESSAVLSNGGERSSVENSHLLSNGHDYRQTTLRLTQLGRPNHEFGAATGLSSVDFESKYPKSASVAAQAWLARSQVVEAILQFCDEFRSLEEIAKALNRQPATAREYIRELTRDGHLERRHNPPSHPMQAYRVVGRPE